MLYDKADNLDKNVNVIYPERIKDINSKMEILSSAL